MKISRSLFASMLSARCYQTLLSSCLGESVPFFDVISRGFGLGSADDYLLHLLIANYVNFLCVT